jgi:hypothetical protein
MTLLSIIIPEKTFLLCLPYLPRKYTTTIFSVIIPIGTSIVFPFTRCYSYDHAPKVSDLTLFFITLKTIPPSDLIRNLLSDSHNIYHNATL